MLNCEDKEVKQDQNMKEVTFDLVQEYEQKIVPMARELMSACEEIGLPYLMHFVALNDSERVVTGTLASSQGKRCVATGRMMMAGSMVNGDHGIIPVPIDPKNSKSLLLAAALAGLADD